MYLRGRATVSWYFGVLLVSCFVQNRVKLKKRYEDKNIENAEISRFLKNTENR